MRPSTSFPMRLPWRLGTLTLLVGAVVSTAPRAACLPRAGLTDLELGLRGGLELQRGERREYFGLLTLTLPFDAWARPRAAGSRAPAAAGAALAADDAGDGDAVPASESAPTTRRETSDASPSRAPRPSVAPAPTSPPAEGASRRSAARLPRLEPALVLGALRAAWRVAGLDRSRAELQSLADRARSSAWLPELQLRGLRSTDESLRYSDTRLDETTVTQAGGADLLVEARLSWRLSRLVFASEELGVQRLRHERARMRQQVSDRVLEALLGWQTAAIALRAARLPEEQLKAWSQLLRAQTELFVLTGGWSAEALPALEEPSLEEPSLDEPPEEPDLQTP